MQVTFGSKGVQSAFIPSRRAARTNPSKVFLKLGGILKAPLSTAGLGRKGKHHLIVFLLLNRKGKVA